MSQPEIFLVRHGETEWNREGRNQGQLDSPLTKLGRQQAQGVAEILKKFVADQKLDGVVSSPLGRAVATTQIVTELLGIPDSIVTYDDGLQEMTWGSWDGLFPEEIDRRFPGERQRRKADHWSYVPENGESYAMVDQRVRNWFTKFSEHGRYLIIAHGVVNRVLQGVYCGLGSSAVLALDEPQGEVIHLKDGKATRLRSA